MNIWVRMKELVRNENTTQEWVAKSIGVSYRTFNGWISRKIMPNADQAYRIARALHTTVEYLVDGEEGTRYLQELFRSEGVLFQPPPRLADLWEVINQLTDEKLDVLRPMVLALGEADVSRKAKPG